MGSSRFTRYYDINRRTSTINGIGAAAIWLAMGAEVWGRWGATEVIAIGLIPTIGFNMWVNHSLLDRFGIRIEVVRSLVNAASAVVTASLAGWPLAAWLFPPYCALAFDYSGGRYSTFVVMTMLGVVCAAGLASGVTWPHPLAAAVLTVYGWQISEARVHVIRDMLASSDEQRGELARAHVATYAALEDLRSETAARERVELELRAAQKLEALGRIASGIAHEINTPIQFVGDSLQFVQDGLRDIVEVCALNTATRTATDDASRRAAMAAVAAAEDDVDLPYLIENIPDALARCNDGLGRVAAIVRSMKQFARPDQHERAPTDLNQAIEATLTISRHEYKLVADVVTDLGPLPPVVANAGELNQVFLNIIVNAAHAIADAGSATRGTISITTRRERDDVVIAISDTGTGIPVEIRDRVFEPFFTTKAVGRGTGQGLAIARAIVERHGGRLTLDTELGRGTTLAIRIPIEPVETARLAG